MYAKSSRPKRHSPSTPNIIRQLGFIFVFAPSSHLPIVKQLYIASLDFQEVLKMASNISSAKITLSCPLFAADFDPRNNAFLLVAGGGGESRSGVGNKIARPHAFSF